MTGSRDGVDCIDEELDEVLDSDRKCEAGKWQEWLVVAVLSKRDRKPVGWAFFSTEKLWNQCFSRSRI